MFSAINKLQVVFGLKESNCVRNSGWFIITKSCRSVEDSDVRGKCLFLGMLTRVVKVFNFEGCALRSLFKEMS
jgi:hypothetical protein